MKSYQKPSFFIFNEIKEGVQVIDFETRYVYLNKSVELQARTPAEELIGQRMLDKFPALENSEAYRVILDCLEKRTPSKLINEYQHPDGSIGYFDLHVEPIDEGVIIFSLDVTEMVLLKKEMGDSDAVTELKDHRIKELEAELKIESDLYECKSNFVSLVSQQFRTPQTSIILSAPLIEQFGNDLRSKEALKFGSMRVGSSANDMVAILNDFLINDERKSESSNVSPAKLDFQPHLCEVLNTLLPILKKGQYFDISMESITCSVNVNAGVLRAVLLNLLSNAIKYSDEGTEIALRINVKNGALNVEVEDQGIGIPDEERENVFKKFYRTNNTKDTLGTGLGLHIVREYLDLVGGSIEFESEVGKGTLFRVQLPKNELITVA